MAEILPAMRSALPVLLFIALFAGGVALCMPDVGDRLGLSAGRFALALPLFLGAALVARHQVRTRQGRNG